MKTYRHDGPSGSDMRLRRLLSVLLDAFLCFMIGYVVFVMLVAGSENIEDYGKTLSELGLFGILFNAMPIYLPLFFLKDIFGRSLGKVIFGLYIVEKGTCQRASFGKRFFRNFPLIMFPLEGIAVLISETNTRIADKLLEIEVVRKAD